MTTYDDATVRNFKNDLPQGKEGEAILDARFNAMYLIFPVPVEAEQALGIDRVFIRRGGGILEWADYKADEKCGSTGNGFIELSHKGKTYNKDGWAKKSLADWILYYFVPFHVVYALRLSTIRERIEDWKTRFPTKPAKNEAYETHGVRVPMRELKQIATRVYQVSTGGAK